MNRSLMRAFAGLCVCAHVAFAGLDDGLVAYYPFSGDASDASGNGHNGTVNGATLITDRFGNPDSAYGFDGNDYITFGDVLDIGNEDLSVVLWVEATSFDQYAKLINKGQTKFGTPINTGYSIRLLGGFRPEKQLAFQLIDNSGKSVFAGYSLAQLPLNKPVCVAGILKRNGDLAEVKLFVNGQLVAHVEDILGPIDTNLSLALGALYRDGLWTITEEFDGKLDDVRIYNRALSEEEVSELYSEMTPQLFVHSASLTNVLVAVDGSAIQSITISNAGDSDLEFSFCPPSSVNDDSLVAYYPFNGNANDESGNGHNGTINGATLAEDRFGNAESAYDFNGVSDYINCGNIIDGFSNYTVSAWINIDRYTHYRYMGPWGQMWFANSSPDVHSSLCMYTTSDPTYGFGMSMRWDDGTLINTRVGHAVPRGEWHLISQTYDGVEVCQYDNGQLVNSTVSVGHTVGNTWDFIIGKTAAYPNFRLSTHYFDGTIDDLSIYNRALSGNEVAELYNDVPVDECDLPDWLTIEPESGVVAPGQSMDISVMYSASNMVAGEYVEHMLQLHSNDPEYPELEAPVSMWVVPSIPAIFEEPLCTVGRANEIFWSNQGGPVEYWVEAKAVQHYAPSSGAHDGTTPPGWEVQNRFAQNMDDWNKQSGWIPSTSYLFTGLRLNTIYMYRVKASVDTEIGRLEGAWSDWVPSCQVPVLPKCNTRASSR